LATAKQTAYDVIRHGIFSGRFPPGHQIKEEELAAEVGVSRTPIRQAIRTLADEGLLEIRSNRRSYVTQINEDEFEQLFDLLQFLESYNASLATTHISPVEISELKSLNKAMAKADRAGDNGLFLELNSRFHTLIHDNSPNDKIKDLLNRVIQYPHNLYLNFGQIPSWHNKQSIVEHDQIIAALETGDASYVSTRMQAHTESVRVAFRQLWQAVEDNQA